MICITSNHLRRCIARRPTGCLECFIFLISIAQAKVHQLDLSIMIQQQVLWLHISMNNAQLVQILDS